MKGDAAGEPVAHPDIKIEDALVDAHEWIAGRLSDQEFASDSLPILMDAALYAHPEREIEIQGSSAIQG